jgi:hypothetical protein
MVPRAFVCAVVQDLGYRRTSREGAPQAHEISSCLPSIICFRAAALPLVCPALKGVKLLLLYSSGVSWLHPTGKKRIQRYGCVLEASNQH